jgi:hypothetical protein
MQQKRHGSTHLFDSFFGRLLRWSWWLHSPTQYCLQWPKNIFRWPPEHKCQTSRIELGFFTRGQMPMLLLMNEQFLVRFSLLIIACCFGTSTVSVIFLDKNARTVSKQTLGTY